MRHVRRNLAEGPSHIIRWQGAQLVLDHSRNQGMQGSGPHASAFAMNVNKGTRP